MYVDEEAGGADPVGPMGASLPDGMSAFVQAAATGQVEVSEEGGNAMLAVLQRFTQEARDWESRLFGLSQPPLLGRLKGGEVMAPFMVQVATDENGFLTRFRELQESLTQAEEGIRKAMANYQATEEANRASMNRLAGET